MTVPGSVLSNDVSIFRRFNRMYTRFIGRLNEGLLNSPYSLAEGRLPYILRPRRVGDMGWIVHREGVGYAEQYGWDETFEALASRIVDQFITNFDPSRERCWIAEIDGAHVGHIFLVKHPDEADTAKLRLLFVEPSARSEERRVGKGCR